MPPHCVFLSHPQPRDTGDYRHRVTLPGQALARYLDVAELQTTHPEFLPRCLAADLVVVGMVADAVVLRLIEARRARGLATVYEISDDFRDFPPSLPGHSFYAQPQVQAAIEAAAGAADLLQFSSHGLQRKYGALNPNSVVFPNQLAAVPPLRETPAARLQRPVLGWAGSVGHRDEARELAGWLKDWLAARPDLRRKPPVLRLMAADSVVRLFKSTGLQVEATPPGSFEQYLAFLQRIDIGFAVLGHTDFSAGRSDGKFLEYASQGVLCLASRAGEYAVGMRHGETGFLFGDRAEFLQGLNQAFDDADTRRCLVAAAHAHVQRERTHAHAALARLQAYRALLPRERQGLLAAEPAPRPDGEGQLRTLVEPVEALLLEATQLHGQGALEPALGRYLQALQTWPDFYLPWERGGLVAQALGSPQDAALFQQTAAQKLQQQLDTGAL